MARLIDGLSSLRAEFDAINPDRDRRSDGWIGDDKHSARISDHNPDSLGDVYAIDVDVNGVPMAKIVSWIVARCKAGRETRLQYVIFRRTIWSRSWGWTARRYRGANPHTAHAHFSARRARLAGDTAPWGVAGAFGPHTGAAPAVKPRRRPAAHPPGSRTLEVDKPALSGADVTYVQRWIGEERCGPPDGTYGPVTRSGVLWYQRMRGLARDGVVGPRTWRNMGVRWLGK